MNTVHIGCILITILVFDAYFFLSECLTQTEWYTILRSPPVFGGVRGAQSLFFYVLSFVQFVCLSFYFLAMALSGYSRSMSLTVPLISFAPPW